MSEVFGARRRSRQIRRLLRASAVALAVAAIGAGVWIVWFSSVLSVDAVHVLGVTSFPTRRVVQAAEVDLGQPLARVDTQAVRAQVAKLRRVDSVDVRRSWPHTLRITIHERVAVAWTSEAGQMHGVDRRGIEFREYRRRPKLVEVRAAASDADTHRRALQSLGSVVVDLRRGFPALLAATDYLSADTRDSIELHLRGGRLVVWGSATKATQKVEALRVLLNGIKARRYDVSVPEQPTTAN